MNWLSNLTPPGIKNIFKKPDNNTDTLWVKCGGCGEMIFHRDLEVSHRVCPSCSHHMLMLPEDRLKLIFDHQKFDRIQLPDAVHDPLKFKDTKRYSDRLKEHRKRTGEQDGLVVATGTIEAIEIVAAIQNFGFMGGSMGMAVGEGFVKAAEIAVEKSAPLVMFTASGGARMQESILALMQMPRTTIAVEMLREAKLPFIVVLTNPTTGGVMASFAMLGDVHIAEPGALLGFAGRRVIEQTIREKLPQEFQKSEFLLEKGMVDIVVHRHELRMVLAKLIGVLSNSQRVTVTGTSEGPATATLADDIVTDLKASEALKEKSDIKDIDTEKPTSKKPLSRKSASKKPVSKKAVATKSISQEAMGALDKAAE